MLWMPPQPLDAKCRRCKEEMSWSGADVRSVLALLAAHYAHCGGDDPQSTRPCGCQVAGNVHCEKVIDDVIKAAHQLYLRCRQILGLHLRNVRR